MQNTFKPLYILTTRDYNHMISVYIYIYIYMRLCDTIRHELHYKVHTFNVCLNRLGIKRIGEEAFLVLD